MNNSMRKILVTIILVITAIFLFACNPTVEKVATPTFTPAAGTFTTAQSVTIACATTDATIRYTTDGTNPTATTGTVYSTAINVATTTTIKAIAYKTGMTDSDVATALYTINTTK